MLQNYANGNLLKHIKMSLVCTYRLGTALINKLASCPLLTSSCYASRETIEIEQWSLFEAWADFGRAFLEAGHDIGGGTWYN